MFLQEDLFSPEVEEGSLFAEGVRFRLLMPYFCSLVVSCALGTMLVQRGPDH